MRVRTWHFFLSGALGGSVGFLLMEAVARNYPAAAGTEGIFPIGLQFCAFGLAVGAALGMTEGVIRRQPSRLAYGLVLGLVLGAVGGFAGGAAGQAIYSLLPEPSPPPSTHNDVAIVLDASGSMEDGTFLLWKVSDGNDPKGLRKVAARKLVEKLGALDRVTILDFADTARVIVPLTVLSSAREKRRVLAAIDGVGVRGGTNLSAGLSAAIGELIRKRQENRLQHIIFLTDGAGFFDPSVITPAQNQQIKIHTIGLGSAVERSVLERAIAKPTGGSYHPVSQADQLWPAFETILAEVKQGNLVNRSQEDVGDPLLKYVLLVLGWLTMGLIVGVGQGIRENTREDLLACSLGGLVGGLVGGALFEPISHSLQYAEGLVGLGVADVIVGACIGGSMRLAQGYLVERRTVPTSTLLRILPEKSTSLVQTESGPSDLRGRDSSRSLGERPGSLRGLVLQVKQAVEGSGSLTPSTPSRVEKRVAEEPSRPDPPVPSMAPKGRRRPLSFYENRYPGNRSTALRMASQSGHYSAEELAEHFGLPLARVQQVLGTPED